MGEIDWVRSSGCASLYALSTWTKRSSSVVQANLFTAPKRASCENQSDQNVESEDSCSPDDIMMYSGQESTPMWATYDGWCKNLAVPPDPHQLARQTMSRPGSCSTAAAKALINICTYIRVNGSFMCEYEHDPYAASRSGLGGCG